MGCDDDFGMTPERVVLRQGLDLKHVQAGTGQLTRIQCRDQVVFDQVLSPGDVDQLGAGG